MTYVMSDIHGDSVRFERIMKQINLQPNDTLYILGDVIDRNPDGIRILRKIMKMPNVKMLLGNHEYMMMDALVYPPGDKVDKWEREYAKLRKLRHWYENGGDVTHAYLKRIRKELRQEIFDYIASLPLNIEVEANGQKFLLVHAGVAANYGSPYYNYSDAREYAVWSRRSYTERIPEDTILIFGHTPTVNLHYVTPMEIWHKGNYIGIDCGACYDYMGRLACLRLDDLKEYYSEYYEGEKEHHVSK